MARITHVRKAQQRYALVPALNEDGTPKTAQYTNKDGSPKLTKHGRPVVAQLTVEDRSQPLPMPECESCHLPIEVGTPYKHVTPHGGRKRNRHEDCPNWQPWDLSNSLSARVALLQSENAQTFDEDSDAADVEQARDDLASAIRELAEEKRESAQNLADGFGHETQQSLDLEEIADNLDGWADEVEGIDIGEKPEPPEDEDPGPEGEPEDDSSEEWNEWDAIRTAWDEYQTDLDDWVQTVNDAYDEALNNSPV